MSEFRLKFSANVSTMFNDVEFLERFDKASSCGFNVVEIQNPYDYSPDLILEHKRDLKVDLINMHGGPSKFGLAAVPMQDDDFQFAIDFVNVYHPKLLFNKLHIMSGERVENFTEEEQQQYMISTLKSLNDWLQTMEVTAVIEPICKEVNENYFLNSFETAIKIIEAVDSKNVKLLLDIYHLHKITEDVRQFLPKYYPYAGHVQVSQDPGRTEPFCPGGKIDYRFVFDYLRRQRYESYIGLEYFYSGSDVSDFEWLANYT